MPLLKKKEIFAIYWNHSNQRKKYELKGKKCAEVLVPEQVDPVYIFGAYVARNIAFNNLCKICGINVIIKKEMFFLVRRLL